MKQESDVDGNVAALLLQTVVYVRSERERTQTTVMRENLLDAGDTCRFLMMIYGFFF